MTEKVDEPFDLKDLIGLLKTQSLSEGQNSYDINNSIKQTEKIDLKENG